jgi:diphthine-ammonia ligase
MNSEQFFSSWSGGKDSSLALYKEIESGGAAKLLLSIFGNDGQKSRAHGLRREIIKSQSESIGVPLKIVESEWGSYSEVFSDFLKQAKLQRLDVGVFGDIDLIAHREWIENLAKESGVVPHFPLWGMEREQVVREFIEKGFQAVIVSCRKDSLDKSFLGRKLDLDILEEFREMGVDLAGENGEYHTLVLDGPIFRKKLDIKLGKTTEDEKHHYVEVEI